jgi:CubicO group peptidase (beta-lactamase class C family)
MIDYSIVERGSSMNASMKLPVRRARGVILAWLLTGFCAISAGARAAAPDDGALDERDRAAIARIEAPRLTEAEAAAATDAPATKLGRLPLAEVLGTTGTPALSLAYFRDGAVAWARAWGVADAESREPATDRTLFQAASISKPVSAVAILEAVERGLIQLDRPVNEQLRGWRLPDNELTDKRAVTPRLLLCHAGGTTVHGFPGYEPTAALPSVTAILDGTGGANTKAVRVDLEPGTKERYSGGGTTILQLLLSEVAGKPFPDVLREWVLEPAGMTDSAFDQPPSPERAAKAARGHLANAAPAPARWHVYPELAAAGLWTTPRDLSLLAIEVWRARRGDSDRLLTAESAKLMTTPAGIGSFALGFEMQDRGSDELGEIWYYGHSGGNWGFRSVLVADREQGQGFVAMINGSDFNLLLEVQRRIARAYEWKGDFTKRPRNWPKDQ